jgi:(Z)-2-((N-methylformamido)methylene)-5-hydroxybutyrolactone dehydrogenase
MAELPRHQLFIGGRWTEPSNGASFETFDPYTAEPWALVPRATTEDVNRAVAAAKAAFVKGPWSQMTATARGAVLRKLGDLIARDAERLAQIETHDNGKLLTEMRAQLNYLPQWYYFFGGLADKINGSVVPLDRSGAFAYTRHEPLGVIAAITPWNSPLLLASWKIAPALAAGNTVVLKPSEHASVSALALAELFEEAGVPPGVFNVITGFGHEIGEALVAHPDVVKVAFTGGESGGRSVYGAAARELKGALLELGGKSPNLVFEDADLEAAANGVIAGIFAASGQTCIAGSRLIVHESVHDELVTRLVALARGARLGDPSRTDTHVGPVTTQAQYRKVLDYIEIAKGEGATCVLGGGAATDPACGRGWFVQPTIFTNVDSRMRIAQEEVFGPVLAVIRFRDEDEAVQIANDTRYGLAAGIWTRDLTRALRLEPRLSAGTVWVNTYRALSVLLPFGGYKNSGIGRENGIDAIKEYLGQKSVWINTTGRSAPPFSLQ